MRTIFVLLGLLAASVTVNAQTLTLARRKLQDAVSSIRRRQTSLFVDIQRKRSDKRK